MEHLGYWAEFADSRVAIVIYHGSIMVLIVIAGTLLGGFAAIWVIERSQDFVREFKAWLRKPRKLNGMWA